MSSVSLYNANDPYEVLISQMIAIERQPQDKLKTDKKNQERLKLVMSDVDSKISALHTIVKGFQDTFNSPFRGRSANVPTTSAFTVSAGDTAAYGAHTLQVERLASADTRLSRRYDTSGSALSAYADTTQAFDITINKPEAPGGQVTISVTADLTGKTTDGDILAEVNRAINTAMDDAVTAGTISASEKSVASLVHETSGTSRLTVRSGKTGFENQLQFSGSAFLDALEVTETELQSDREQVDPDAGGAVKKIGTGELDSDLNSKFVLDGLTLYRSTNTVTDAVDGLTFNLKKADNEPVEFSVTADATGIKDKVNDFIKKYNDLLVYIQNKSTVDADAGTRGDFASDATFRNLRYNLRNDLSRQVTSQAATAPSSLTALGIEIGKDGTLTLKDESKLLAAVEKDAGAVESLFAHDGANEDEDGLAVRLLDRLQGFVGASGLVNERKKSLDTRIQRLNDRIKSWDQTLSQRETSLRTQFAKMQETIAILQGQGQSLSSILGYY